MSVHRLLLSFVLLLAVTQAPCQVAGAQPPAAASSAAAPGDAQAREMPAVSRQHTPPTRPPSLHATRPAPRADGSSNVPAPPAPAASLPGQPASISDRARREAEHPYIWIRRNGELAYQRYAARVAQARAEGLPPPPTRAASGRLPLPATAFDPEALPPTGAGPAPPGRVNGPPQPSVR